MFQPPRGTRDILPDEMKKKNWVIDRVREVYEAYGFEPLGTPAFENLEMLQIKSGEDILDQIYAFKDKSDRELALRFEWTASTVRVVAMHKELQLPFKRYAIGPVWRYERPTEKRFREFWQADVDIFGVESSIADAEVLSAAVEALKKLSFEGFIINLNDRRILKALVEYSGIPEEKAVNAFRSVDKITKIGQEGVIEELKNHSINEEKARKLLDLINIKGSPEEILGKIAFILEKYPEAIKGINALESLYEYAKAYGFHEYIIIDLSLARGLDYYTGPVYEILSKDYPDYGSIAGGGRYDEIVELFGGDSTFATGVSFGVDRLVPILEKKGAFEDIELGAKIHVAPVSENMVIKAIEISQTLRKNNIPTNVDLLGRKLSNQFEHADKKGVQYIVIVGEKDLQNGVVTVRNMITGEQKKVKTDLIDEFFKII